MHLYNKIPFFLTMFLVLFSVRINASVPTIRTQQIEFIDLTDTVIFDFTSAIVTGKVVEVPMIIFTDEKIEALDFSFLLDTNNIEYLSLTNHTNHIEHSQFLNPTDSKFRFTSFSLDPYPIGTRVVSIRFRTKSVGLLKSDMSETKAFLNGEACTAYIKGEDIMTTGTNSTDFVLEEFFNVYPNPSSSYVDVEVTEAGMIQLISIDGILIDVKSVRSKETKRIKVDHLPAGMYTIIYHTKSNNIFQKQLIIN